MRAPRSLSNRLVAAQLVAVLAVLGGGIAGAQSLRRPDSGNAQELVAQAATKVTAAGSYRTTYSFSLKASGLSVMSRGTGFADTVRHLQSGTFEIPGGLGMLEFRQVADVIYLRLPGGRTDAQGHHWISAVAPAAQAEQSFGGQDPLAFLRTLSDPAGVTDLGPAKVDGVATTHYRMTLDPGKVVAALGQAGQTLPAGAADQVKDVRTDVWLDAAHLPRRLQTSLKAAGATATFTFTFADFGGQVTVAAPEASDVTTAADPSQLTAALQGALVR
ncbi:MAG: hypothetical protein LC789_18160 [Actinobacteria bacterium]|nr:hypothetical protein [Actinomycetota bacterium]MCA1722563.1 hypothetical protein [Actinomycetota bacterium]